MELKPSLHVIDGPEIAGRIPFLVHLTEDFDVTVVGADPEAGDAFSKAGISYSFIPVSRGVNPIKDLILLYRYVRCIKQGQPQIVHTFGSKTGIWGRIAARITGRKVISGTITGLGSMYAPGGLRRRLTKVVFDFLFNRSLKVAATVVFQNTRDKDELVETGIVRESAVSVIHGSGVDTSRFFPDHTGTAGKNLRNQLGVGSSTTLVLMVSRIIRSKGVMEYAALAKRCLASGIGASFLLIGTVDEESSDRLSRSEFDHLKSAVVLLGERSDVDQVMKGVDLFVLPTRYREGLPRVVLEAGSIGLPIVTTNEGSANGTAVRDGFNGYVVDPSDPDEMFSRVSELLDDEEIRKQFGGRSRHLVETRLSVSKIADQYRLLFNRLFLDRQHSI